MEQVSLQAHGFRLGPASCLCSALLWGESLLFLAVFLSCSLLQWWGGGGYHYASECFVSLSGAVGIPPRELKCASPVPGAGMVTLPPAASDSCRV